MVVKKKARREGTTTSSLMRSCLIKLNSFNSVHRGNKRARVCVCFFVYLCGCVSESEGGDAERHADSHTFDRNEHALK